MSDRASHADGKSEQYLDSGFDETERPVRNPGVKLPPNDHARFYNDVQGMSEARSVSELTKEANPLPRRVRRCMAHPGDKDYDGFLQ
jgi:hypothetical protein